jgi:23S rRNA pseudouridine1911/1915/1917 synthase
MAVREAGKEARTGYEVRTQYEHPVCALVECRLETGRTHQIRVHLAAIGHPVVGDPEYGGALRITGLERQFLHSERIAFTHPVDGASVQVRAPLPEDLREALRLASGERGLPSE